MTTSAHQRLGSSTPRLTLYIPHLPIGLESYVSAPSVTTLLAQNSNHWRKIVTLAAKVAAPTGDWRHFRDHSFFEQVALVFSPTLEENCGWHWIGGGENRARFSLDSQCGDPLPLSGADDLFIIPNRKILLSPYPDYRQLSNQKVELIRQALQQQGFYPEA